MSGFVLSKELEEQVGKIASGVFRDTIFPRLGASRDDVLVGPRHGLDAGIIRVGGGQVLGITTDPFYVQPELGWERAAWFAVNIVASDAATTGLIPSHLAVDLNLPPAMTNADLAELWTHVHDACRKLGLAVVAGHTGRYEGCSFPMLGGATVLALGPEDCYVTPSMARPGDAVVITKGVAIETASLLAVSFPDRLVPHLGAETVQRAQNLFWRMSVVRDAAVATSIGVRGEGVTSMHDATERGLFGGLHEIAEASGVGMVIEANSIGMAPEVRAICSHFGIDPFTTSSEGTLILTCGAPMAEVLVQRLGEHGIPAYRIGEVLPPKGGLQLLRDGRSESLPHPKDDPFWPAFTRAREGSVS